MATNIIGNDSALCTIILVRNIHCASCVSYIEKNLTGALNNAVFYVETNILSHEVTVHHNQSTSAKALCQLLSDAAFEIYSATTCDHAGTKTEEIGANERGEGWLEAATEIWRPPHRASSSGRDQQQLRTSKHMANCDACRKGSVPPRGADLSTARLVDTSFGDNSTEQLGSSGTYDEEKSRSISDSTGQSVRSAETPDLEAAGAPTCEATLSIGGMTCASCTNAVTHGLAGLDYVKSINVTLMTNSAWVVFNGWENLQNIVDIVEDLGYDCAVEHSGLVDSEEKTAVKEQSRRSVMLKVDGMFCKHCPPRVVDAIMSQYGSNVALEKGLTWEDPIMKVTYTPQPPRFSLRNIIAAIESPDASFSARVYTPPSIEQRSQAMQRDEQHRLLIRLLLSFVIAIPTLLIGVVWMSLVPASNGVRQFLEQPVWAGMVTRTDWALFILATPVYFLAGDVFHLRAVKEIRALWRRSSKVPLLQRFYRFGSMNLLISAGTSVAYFASIAVLGIDATASEQSSSQSSTYFDTVVFLTFFILVGRYLEAYSKAKTGNAVGMLSNLRPREAILVESSSEDLEPAKELEKSKGVEKEQSSLSKTKQIQADFLEVGDAVMVYHGSTPPADGIIVIGTTKFNESSLTGESCAVPKQPGDAVFAGAINVGDPIRVRITEIGGTSMLDQIVAVVREGQTKRAPVEGVVDTLTGYFVPVITALAITTFLIWLVLGYSGALSEKYIGSQRGSWAFWSLEFAIAVFVVACPCGIGLAAPTALFVGSGLAASHGILVRGGGEAFQEASNIDAVVFDKTGTLTEGGDLKVTDHEMLAKDDMANIAWSLTRSLEESSSHPMARAILGFAKTQSTTSILTKEQSITEKPGLGLQGTFTIQNPSTNETVTCEAALGSETLLSTLTPPPKPLTYFTSTALSTWKSHSKSIALLALRELPPTTPPTTPPPWTLAATFAISDPLRPSAIPTITTLRDRGIPVYMLTGDNAITASAVASTLSIPQDHVFAGVLPTEKADKIRWLQENAPHRSSASTFWLRRLLPQSLQPRSAEKTKRNATIAFIGDGINDAPALSQTPVSISFASASDIAMTSSSFVLLSPTVDLTSLLTLISLSRRVFTRVKFNIAWAVVYNVLLVPLAAGVAFRVREDGWRLGPVWGSAAMAGSSLCVVGSSLALRWEGGLRGVWRWVKGVFTRK